MARFGFVGPSYSSQSLNADAQKTLNWYVEQIESGQGKSALALYPTPGLALFCPLGGASANNFRGAWNADLAYNTGDAVTYLNGTYLAVAPSVGIPPATDPTHWFAIPTVTSPVRGLFGINGRVFAVGAATLFEILPTGKSIARGNLVNDGLPASMAASPSQLLIASGGSAYVFNLSQNTLTQIETFATNGIQVSMVGFSDGFFLALQANSQQFYVSAPEDATTWNLSVTTIVSVFPDNVLALLVDHREIWLWGATKSVVYYDSGAANFPFDVVPGGFIEQGIAAPASAVRLDNSVFWLGADDRGGGIGWRAQGYSPARITNHAVETALAGYPTIADAIGYSYQDQGHSFWVLYFPSALPSGATWVYDVATQMWHERAFWDQRNGVFTAHRSRCHVYAFGKHLVGDWATGNIYQMSIPKQNSSAWSFADDFGNAIRRIRRAPHIATEQQWIFHHEMQVDVEAGLGPIPPLSEPFPGPQTITLQDASGAFWNLSVTDTGILQTTKIASGVAQLVVLNDETLSNTAWQLGVNTNGTLSVTAVAYNPQNPLVILLSSSPGQLYTALNVAGGLLQTRVPTPYARDPQIMLRWSDDGGKTWSNQRLMNCGQSGNFKTRAIARRMGRSRDRIYEISANDPIPWRIVDAYLQATPGFAPQERLVSQLRKSG